MSSYINGTRKPMHTTSRLELALEGCKVEVSVSRSKEGESSGKRTARICSVSQCKENGHV